MKSHIYILWCRILQRFRLTKQEIWKQVSEHIESEKLGELYPFLIYQVKLCEARMALIEDGAENYRKHQIQVEKSSFSADCIIKLQATQLDLISKLCMFTEDYLSFSYYLRTCRKELPRKVQSKGSVIWEEIDSLEELTLEKITEHFLFTKVEDLAISEEDKNFVREVFDLFINALFESIKRIIAFYRGHNRVYNKYKHIFSPHIGTYSVEENVIKPRIFVRDEYTLRKTNIKSTYILSTTIEALQYYEKLKDDVKRVFLTLLETHVHSIQNCGNPFLIPDGFFLPNDKKKRWQEIVKKVNLVTGIQELNLRIYIKPTIRMLEELINKHIFKIDKDIFDSPENALRLESIT